MATEIPTVQILDKKNYFTQALVSLPRALPYAPLAPSSVRLRTAVLSLTVNNFTYAALGDLLHWWDVHRLPASAPPPYDDAARYGRISAWGYAQVVASTAPAVVPAGVYVWGYVPLGTLAEDLGVTARSSAEIAARAPGAAHDAVLRVMHATAFLMASFVFSPDPARVVAPGTAGSDAWGAGDADLADATVLVFAPGSKAAALFAALLRARTPADRPRRVVGVSSEASRAFVAGTGLYDAVVLTSADPGGVVVVGGADGVAEKRVVVFDFGGRAGVGPRWAAALVARYPDLLFVGVGSALLDPGAVDAVLAGAARTPPYRAARVNAGDMRRRAMERVGEETYWAEEARSWEVFRRDGIKGLGMTWGEGMGDVIKGWDRLARGEVLPSEGLVFKL
ncbi:hypothetical protein F4823DRAFT_638267 [Ustulina deusta]|nr:hypothetical protein F4823DRAFT_638267 [Ustulina deusta]